MMAKVHFYFSMRKCEGVNSFVCKLYKMNKTYHHHDGNDRSLRLFEKCILQAVAEVFAELFHQAVWPVAGWFETTHEETEYRRFVNEL